MQHLSTFACLFCPVLAIGRKPRKFFQNSNIFINLLSAVTSQWNLPTLPNNTQIDGHLPRINMVKFVYE